MNKIIKDNIFQIINLIVGIILVATPFLLFPVCTKLMPNGHHMMCFYTGKFFMLMGVIIIITNLIAIKLNTKMVYMLIHLVTLIVAALCYLIPYRIISIGDKTVNGWQLSLCKTNMGMSCRTTTMPAVHIMIAVLMTVSIIGLIREFLIKRR